MPANASGRDLKALDGVPVRDAIDRLEKDLKNVAALLPKSCPGAPRLRSPYTVSEAVSLDEIEKKAAAKASTVCSLRLAPW
jgi:hypothetical protein